MNTLLLRIVCVFAFGAAAWQHWIFPMLGSLAVLGYYEIRRRDEDIDDLIAVDEEENEE